MRADELRQAVDRIVEILVGADIRGAVDRFRIARGDERTIAAARLGHAGALVMERFESLGAVERLVVRSLHLHQLADQAYWRALVESSADPKARAGELVRLASRVVFATGQLPGLLRLLDAVDDGAGAGYPLGDGEARLVVRLIDAGERASDPDRIARSIDGIDMLYSACASIARKPAMDLRLETVDGDAARDIHLTGEREAVAAVAAVLDSIPEAVADLDEESDVDLDDLVRSLPVFEDLATLGALGSFPEPDLRDIAETMHQGALLALESGAVRVPPTPPAPVPARRPAATAPVAVTAAPASAPAATRTAPASPPVLSRRPPATDASRPAAPAPAPAASANGASRDRSADPRDDPHYERYLREREAMRRPKSPAPSEAPRSVAAAQTPRDSVDEMLRSLGKARGEG